MKKFLILIVITITSLLSFAQTDKDKVFFEKSTKFDDWNVTCIYQKSLDNDDKTSNLTSCQTVHSFKIGDEEIRIYTAYETNNGTILDNPSLYLQVALDAYLKPQISIQIDDNKALEVSYNFCDSNGCYAGGLLDNNTLEQMRNGKEVNIIFYNREHNPIKFSLSLSGYRQATKFLLEKTIQTRPQMADTAKSVFD